jgi:hypothetical protein
VLGGEREEGGSVGNGREAGWGKREGGAAYILGFATGWTVGWLTFMGRLAQQAFAESKALDTENFIQK